MPTLWDAFVQAKEFGASNADFRIFKILGRRSSFTSTSVLNDVKEFAAATAAIPTLAGTELLEVVSDSANDTSNGTGARKVRVTYINTDYDLVESAEITLNGITAVNVAWGAMEILWMEVTTAGSGAVAAGNITLQVRSAGAVLEQISTGQTRSLAARFMVPDGYIAFLLNWHGAAIGTTHDLRLVATVRSLGREINTVWVPQDEMFVPSGNWMQEDLPLLALPARSRVKVATLAGTTEGTLRCDVAFAMALVKA